MDIVEKKTLLSDELEVWYWKDGFISIRMRDKAHLAVHLSPTEQYTLQYLLIDKFAKSNDLPPLSKKS